MSIRVGIDVRTLSQRMTGIGRYTAELTRELTRGPGEFCIYSGGSFPTEQWQQDHVVLRSANLHARIAKMLWSQTYLPYWAAKDHVDVFWGTTHRLPRYLPPKIARVVTIHDLVWKHHGDTMRPLSRLMESILMPQAVRMADRIVADSNSTADAIKAEFPTAKDKVKIVYPGIAELPTPLDFQSLSALGVEHPYFLFVGTLEPRKNLKRLLKAYAMLNSDDRKCSQLVIAGGKGWGNVNLHQLIADLDLNDHVVLTGYVTDKQLSTLYANALFLAMPSVYEGFGLPIVEAMSYGKPVLTSNVSSMPEVAGEAAVLIDPFDEHSIVMGLKTLLHDETREKFATKATTNAARFTLEASAEKLWEVFQEAIEIRKINNAK